MATDTLSQNLQQGKMPLEVLITVSASSHICSLEDPSNGLERPSYPYTASRVWGDNGSSRS